MIESRGRDGDKPSPYERKLLVTLHSAISRAQEPARSGAAGFGGSSYAFPFEIHRFSQLMAAEGERGIAMGASAFARETAAIARTARSRLLTALVRTYHDTCAEGLPVRESEVAAAAAFVNALLAAGGDAPALVLSWVEDMDTDDPPSGLERQPTAVIRGVLFAPGFDHVAAEAFWRLAAGSERFPLRVFSDPCPPDEGPVFSGYHRRAFGLFFAAAPEEAVRRFAGHVRDRAVRKSVLRDEPFHLPMWQRVDVVPASESELQVVLAGIVGYIDDPARRELVAMIFAALGRSETG